MDEISNLVSIVSLLAANAFFVAAEFALVKVRDLPARSLTDEDSAAARMTERIHGDLDAYLAACQLGITMASLGLGWVGASVVGTLLDPLFHGLGEPKVILHSSAVVIGFLLITSLHVVIGGQLPKILAIRSPELVSLWVAYSLHLFYLVTLPLNRSLERATRGLFGLLGAKDVGHGDVSSTEEPEESLSLLSHQIFGAEPGLSSGKQRGRRDARDDNNVWGLAESFKKYGEINDDNAEILHKLFEADQRPISHFMIASDQVHTLDLACKSDQNLFVLCETGHSRFPLVDGANDGRISGIVVAYDVFNGSYDWESDPWRDLRRFCREPLQVPETLRVAELFALMRIKRTPMALVTDSDDKLAGIITLDDLLQGVVAGVESEM